MTFPICIGGEFIQTAQTLDVTCSYDGSLVGTTYLAGQPQLEKAIKMAEEVRAEMKEMPSWKKYDILMKSASALRLHKDEMAKIIAGEAAKPLKLALGEVDRAIQTFEVAAEESRRVAGEFMKIDWTQAGSGKEAIIKYFPAGIVSGISPFNFPLNLAIHKIAPAIAAGCPIILKPSRNTPLSMLYMAQLMAESGLPKGALSVLPLDRECGNQMVTDPRFAVLTFTGSPEVGWKMKTDAGKKKVVLELGGNAGVVVDKSADLNVAVPKVLAGAFAYAGQVCIHTQRIFVHEEIFDAFAKAFAEATSKLKMGSPFSADTDISSMIDEANAIRVESWVQDAVKDGAKILCGGKRTGAAFEPTVLIDTKPEMNVCCMEIFGPVVTLEKFSDYRQAIQQVNDSRFGLQAGVFTDSLDHMKYAFNTLDVGGVMINEVPTFRVDHAPYGGIKDSGLGREGVKYAMMDYMEMKILVY